MEKVKIHFDTPIDAGDVLLKAVTVDHRVIYADQIVNNMVGGAVKTLPITGLSDEDLAIHDEWLDMVNRNIKAEYQTGEVTERLSNKLAVARANAEALVAEKAELEASEAIKK